MLHLLPLLVSLVTRVDPLMSLTLFFMEEMSNMCSETKTTDCLIWNDRGLFVKHVPQIATEDIVLINHESEQLPRKRGPKPSPGILHFPPRHGGKNPSF